MGKIKGRAKERRLPKMFNLPDSQAAWSPPPKEELDEHPEWDVQLDSTNRLIVRTAYYKGQLADFAMIHLTKLSGPADEWVEVARVDCCHGSAHRHLFNDRDEAHDRTTLRPLRSLADVTGAYDQAEELMLDGWQEHLRRFGNGRL